MVPRSRPQPLPTVGPRPGSQDPDPTPVEVLQPGRAPRVGMQSHIRDRPTRRMKESKVIDHKYVWAGYKALGFVTEVDDFVDAFYDALPKSARRKWIKGKPVGLAEKLKRVYDHWEKIDQMEAWDNFWENTLEDKAIGAYQGAGAKGAVGVGASPLGPAI